MRLRFSIWSISVFVMLAGLGWVLHPLSANAQEVLMAGPGANAVTVTIGTTTASVNRSVALPTAFSLSTATPNPFNPSTTIAYEMPEQTHVTLTIYNLLGQKVIRLVDQVQAAGRYEAVWHGVNSRGAGVASGVYLYRIVSGSGYTETKRMTLLK
jgi:flagellar hook assembly protein FlgD